MTSDADNYSHSRKWKVGFVEGSNAFADYHVVLLLSRMPVSRHRAHRAQYSTIHTQSTIGQLAIARDVSLVELRPGADTWRRCFATCNSEDTIALVRTC
eukprot:scaffold26_cov397-Pavlova_lutheri.AAC.1